MMEEKDYMENDQELEELDYFEKEEQRKIREELDALLKETNPLNNDRKLTAEELENFYSLTARRRKKKRHSLRKKVMHIAVIGVGVLLIVAIMWVTFNSIYALFQDRENELTEEKKQQLETLNAQISDLQKENEELSSENLRLKSEIEELKSQIQEQSLIISRESSESSNTESSNSNEKSKPTNTQGTQITYYTVQDGDTLWKISTKVYGNGRYYKNIMDYNHIKDENDLIKGMKLAIPKL